MKYYLNSECFYAVDHDKKVATQLTTDVWRIDNSMPLMPQIYLFWEVESELKEEENIGSIREVEISYEPNIAVLSDRYEMFVTLHQYYLRIYKVSNLAKDAAIWEEVLNFLRFKGNDRVFWNYVSVDSGNLSYVTYAKSPEQSLNIKGRVKTSWAKFLKGKARQMGFPEFSDKEIDEACSRFLSSPEILGERAFDYVIVEGSDLVAAYQNGRYPRRPDQSHESYLVNNHWSCMTNKPEFLKMYEENPDKVKLVKIMLGDAYVGRALVWFTDSGRIVLDRVYPSDGGAHTAAVRKWARRQGWVVKVRDSVDGDFEGLEQDFKVTMKINKVKEFPYCDSFRFAPIALWNEDENKFVLQTKNPPHTAAYHFNGIYGQLGRI